jgi:single-stranded DNA-binding protein
LKGGQKMAKHNSVFLYGQVLETPRISKDSDGNYVRGMCAINIIRGVRDFGNHVDNLKYDCPIILTGEPDKVAEMATWKKYDMVEVKGPITTKEVTKGAICKHCGAKTSADGNIVFISPVYLALRETGLESTQEGTNYLKRRIEISNCATLIGTLCRDPETFTTNEGLSITQYQLAVNRKYRIKDDVAENRTDYPWVKSYGSIAVEDAKFLKTGSVVYIDGMIQTREVNRKTVCASCGQEFEWHDSALEVVPYAVEYLQNFVTPEEYEEKIANENENLANDILGSSE